MGVVTDEGASILEPAEITAVEETVNLWKEAEVDALGTSLGGAGGGEGTEEEDDPGLDAPDS